MYCLPLFPRDRRLRTTYSYQADACRDRKAERKIRRNDRKMTRIKKAISKSFYGISIVIIAAITVMVSVQNEYPIVAPASAFSVVPSHSYASTNKFLQQKRSTVQYKRLSGLPSSKLFVKEPCDNMEVETKQQNWKEPEANITYSDFQKALAGLALCLTIATTTLGGFPLTANAQFGPSSGATTTPVPNLNSIKNMASKVPQQNVETTDIDIDLDDKKLKILIDSALNVQRLEEFQGQLDDLITNLRDSITSLASGDDNEEEVPKYDSENNYIRTEREIQRAKNAAREEELIKAQNLRLQVERQERNLLKLQSQPYWFNYFAAFVGATVSTLIMHPIDTIKTRKQVGLEEEEDNDIPWQSGSVAVVDMSSTSATTAKDSTSITAQIGSIASLYEGLTGNLFKEVPPSAVYLGVYETVKYALSPLVAPAYLLWVYLVAGAAGETVGSIIRAPAEAVKSLVQSKTKANALEAAKSIFGTQEGRLNVIRAWSASIGRDVPFGAIQLAAFELIKSYILNNPDIEIDSSTLLSEAVIGAFAGGLGAFVTNPTDVITTRIITQDTSNEGDDAPLGVIEMGKKIYAEEGFGAFFTGWTARVGYWAPAISIFLTCYCLVRRAGIEYNLFP